MIRLSVDVEFVGRSIRGVKLSYNIYIYQLPYFGFSEVAALSLSVRRLVA
jgi:hypothetical protein